MRKAFRTKLRKLFRKQRLQVLASFACMLVFWTMFAWAMHVGVSNVLDLWIEWQIMSEVAPQIISISTE